MGSWLDRVEKSVRSRAGDVWDRGFEVGRGATKAVSEVAGGAKDLAEAPFTDDQYDGFLGTIFDIASKRGAAALGDLVGPQTGLGAGIGGLPEVARRPARDVIGPTLRGAETVYREGVAEPISTAVTVASMASKGGPAITLPGGILNQDGGGKLRLGNFGELFKGDNWHEAYRIAQHRSPGQAIALAIGTKDISDPEEVEKFAATDHYRQWSGMVDAVSRLTLDPTVVVPGVASGLRHGLAAVPASQEAIAAARDGSRVAKFVDRVDAIVDEHGASAAGRIRAELFPDAAEGAYYSDLLASAPDTLTRRRVVGSLMGSAEDFAALTQDAPAISNQIRNLSSDAFDAYLAEKGTMQPGRVALLDTEIQALYPELDRFTKLDATYGTMGEIPKSSLVGQLRANISTSNFYQKNPLATPVRVATNMLPHHWLDLNDARGDIQVSRMLQQSSLDSETQLALRGQYMSQVSAAARQRVAIDIEKQVVQATLDKYGVPKWIVDDVLETSDRLRGEAQGALRQRKYDAAGRGETTIPHADGVEKVALPLHVTQQADLLPMVDVKQLEYAAQAVQGWNWDSGVFDSIRNKYKGARLGVSGTERAKTFAAASNLPVEALEGFYKLWRPATLLRVGWPARVLMDNQLRIMAKIGALAQVEGLATGAARDIKQRLTPWEFTTADGELVAGRGLPKLANATPEQIAQDFVKRGTGEYSTMLRTRGGEEVMLPPAFGTPGDAAQVMKRLNSGSQTFREVVASDEPALLKTYRQGTGTWSSIAPNATEYPGAWSAAVNKQIKGSAFARLALEGKTIDEMVEWLAGRGEQAVRVSGIAEGSIVKAADRANFGKVLAIDEGAGTAKVHFINKAEGTEATVTLPLRSLSAPDTAGARAASIVTGPEYAREMGWSPKSFEAHAADVADQVSRYVPTEGLRAKLLERDLTHADLASVVRDEAKRPLVHGEEIAQALGSSNTFKIVRNVRDGLFKYLGQLPDDVLSRNPYFDAMYRMEGERLVNLYDDAARKAGRTLGEEDLTAIASKARRYALNESQKLLYDLAEKSELAHMLRFASPFFMAWEEVATRWAGIAVDNPAFVARLRMVWNSPEKAGLVTDEHGAVVNGEGQAVDPLTGEKRKPGADRYINLPFSIPGLPNGGKVRFNKQSLNVALSGLPGAGPPVQVAVNELVKNQPSLEDSVKFILPFGSTQSNLSLLLPPAARQLHSAAQGEDDRIYRNNMFRIMGDRMTDYMLGKRKDKPTYAEVKKAADHLKHVQVAASYLLPFTPIYDSPYQPYINAYRNAQERLRTDPNAFGTHEDGSAVGADEWFLDSFGDEYFWLTQSLSKSNDGVQPTIEGFNAREKYKPLIEKHPELGALIIGNEGAGEFSSGVYGSQLAHDTRPGSGVKQRGSYTFEEYADAPEVRLGWIKYGQAMDAIDAERVKRGLPNLQVKDALDLRLIKQAVTEKIGQKYPAWSDAFAQQDTQAWPKKIAALREIASSPELANRADRPDIKGLSEYLRARDAITGELSKRKVKSLTASANVDLAAIWESLKSAIVERYVAFAPTYYRYLERDPLTVEKTSG